MKNQSANLKTLIPRFFHRSPSHLDFWSINWSSRDGKSHLISHNGGSWQKRSYDICKNPIIMLTQSIQRNKIVSQKFCFRLSLLPIVAFSVFQQAPLLPNFRNFGGPKPFIAPFRPPAHMAQVTVDNPKVRKHSYWWYCTQRRTTRSVGLLFGLLAGRGTKVMLKAAMK